jgi:hypothetical protein
MWILLNIILMILTVIVGLTIGVACMSVMFGKKMFRKLKRCFKRKAV